MATKHDDLKALTLEQLKAKLTDVESEYQQRRFQKVTGELVETHLISDSRKNVARIKTLIRKQERAAQKTN